jgi:hypothetical protein
MDRSSGALPNSFSSTTSEESSGWSGYVSRGFHEEPDTVSTVPEGNEDTHIRSDEKAVKGSLPLDVAEIVRRWTHSLQRIHKQSIILVFLHMQFVHVITLLSLEVFFGLHAMLYLLVSMGYLARVNNLLSGILMSYLEYGYLVSIKLIQCTLLHPISLFC